MSESGSTGLAGKPGASGGLLAGLTPRHAVILLIAWLGWVFDVMDVFLLVLVKNAAFKDLLYTNDEQVVDRFGAWALAVTLVGWSLGGLLFGVVADRWGRSRTMSVTILVYSAFTGLAGFSRTWEEFLALRFLAALGIGGEWGTGASMIAEVFPHRSRAAAAGILQAAAGAGFFAATFLNMAVQQLVEGPGAWRYAFFVAAAPAFLALVVRVWLREPAAWEAARARAHTGVRERLGSLAALFEDPELRRRALLGVGLGVVGIFAYWGTTFWAPESLAELLQRHGVTGKAADALKFKGILVMNVGVTLGFLAFIPLTEWLGRRAAFFIFYLGSLVCFPAAFLFSETYAQWMVWFSIAALFASGNFSGFTIYFPELFPTRLRATGASFCYNVGRVAAAPGPVLRSTLFALFGSGANAGAVLGCVYALGFLFIPFLPETKGIRLEGEEPDGEARRPGGGPGHDADREQSSSRFG